MPRNSSGTFSLPLPAVVTGTVIESVWANTSLEDIAQNISESLDRYGRGGMLAPLRNIDGLETLPAITFTAETGTGLYRPGSNKIGIAVAGVGKVIVSSNGTAINPTFGGFWLDTDPNAQVNRFRDRLFVDEGAGATGNRSGSQGSILPTNTEGASWALRDSSLLSIASTGLMALVGVSRSSDQVPGPNTCAGASGFVINNKAAGRAWGLYSDLQHEATATGASFTAGLEVAAKNKGANITGTPYGVGTGVHGVWLAGGGDPSYGGAAANPSNNAIVILKNGHTWNTGISITATAVTGTDGITGEGNAISMARGHRVRWFQPGGNSGLTIRSDVDGGATNSLSMVAQNSGLFFNGPGSVPVLQLFPDDVGGNYTKLEAAPSGSYPAFSFLGTGTDVGAYFISKGAGSFRFLSRGTFTNDEFRVGGIAANPVNFIHIYGNDAGVGQAVISVGGPDTNIDIRLFPKGTGLLKFGTLTANADAPITGYISIKDSTGATRKLAVIA